MLSPIHKVSGPNARSDMDKNTFPCDLLDGVLEADQARQWIAVHTKPRQEKALGKELFQWEIPFYLPLVTRMNVIRGRKVSSQIPLFAGYLFLFASDDERVQAMKSNRTVQLIPVDREFPLIHDLQKIQKLIESDAPLTVEKRLVAGNLVRIKSGSMQGLEGQIISRKNSSRLLVAVSYIQQGVSVEIDDCMVEPI